MKRIVLLAIASLPSFSQTWTELTNTKITDVAPGGVSGTVLALTRSWSGCTPDTANNRLICFGGGHNDYYGNEVYSLNLGVTPATMTRLNNPSAETSHSSCVEALPDGNPNSRHTYSGLKIISGSMYLFGGVPACLAGGFLADLWALDLTSLTWTQKDPVNGSNRPKDGFCMSCGAPPMLVYNPTSGFMYTWGAHAMWRYNPSTNTYTKVTVNFPGSNSDPKYNATPVFNSDTQIAYFFGNGTGSAGNQATSSGTPAIWKVNLSGSGTTFTFTDITSNAGGTCDGLAGAMNPGVAYDTSRQKIVGWPNFGNTVYIFDPATETCTTVSPSGGPPDSVDGSGNQYTSGTYGRWAYFPTIDAFAVVNRANGNAFKFTLGAPACTITTSSLSNVAVGAPVSWTVNTTDCASPTFSVSSGSLPSGLTLNTSTGAITGFAWSAGAASFTIAVSDSNGNPSQAYSPTITNPTLPTTTNTITVKNEGSTTTDFPMQVGRIFTQGEIPSGSLPQAWIGSDAVPTQVDVKSRWSDSSLKHAVLSFHIPTFTAATTYTVTFGVGSVVGNTALTKAQMLDASYDFEATMALTRTAVTKTASARTILNADDYTVWLSGPINTTVVIAHHGQGFACSSGSASGAGSVVSKYDFGFATNCPFRPIFIATFWPLTHQVRVRYIGEVGANTEQAEDMIVDDIVLAIGNASPTTVYDLPAGKSPLTMRAFTRWTKTFWLNATPPVHGINHNLAYLAASKATFNYNTGLTLSGSRITSSYSTWGGLDKDHPYSPANLELNQGVAGSRAVPSLEIAPLAGVIVMWIYSGDYRTQEMALRYTELAAGWPVHFREGDSAKKIDRAQTISGLGHWISASGRPTVWLSTGNSAIGDASTVTADKIVPTTTLGANSWIPESSHMPDWTLTYALTGDYFFLEENWAWASWAVMDAKGADTTRPCGRGPTGMEGNIQGDYAGICGQTRGQAWVFRQRVNAAFLSPDSTPEQGYYDLLVKDAIASWEAIHEISNSQGAGLTAQWNWAHKWGNADCSNGGYIWCNNVSGGTVPTQPTRIPQWEPGNHGMNDAPESNAFKNAAGSLSLSPWMVNWMTLGLGRAKEIGYSTSGLLAYMAPWHIQQITDPGWNPYLVAAYRLPTTNQSASSYLTTWANTLSDICSSTATGCSSAGSLHNSQTATDFDNPPPNNVGVGCALNPDGDGACAAAYIAGAAIAQVADQTDGVTAWNWINSAAMSNSSLNTNPMWAIVPRVPASSSATSTARGTLTTRGAVRWR